VLNFIVFDYIICQLNYQRDQIAAIKDKQQRKEEGEDSTLPHEKPFSAATDTSLAHSTIVGKTGCCILLI